MDWLEQYIEVREGFSRPNWEEVYRYVDEHFANDDQNHVWCEIARCWVNKLSDELPEEYKIYESENFIFLTSNSEHEISLIKSFTERTRKRILSALSGIASDEGFGKHIVLILDNHDHYYRYISDLYPDDGDFGLSAGMYINRGYGHFIFPFLDIMDAEATVAHELTHALLSHLNIPLWIDEGLAVGMENFITGYRSELMDRQMHARHSRFWTEETIQEYWSGESFFRTDDGQELSYHLSQFIINSLSQNYDAFAVFANAASSDDGGESAIKQVYDGSLADLIKPLMGEGDWQAKPEKWKRSSAEVETE